MPGKQLQQWNFGGLPVWLRTLNSTLRTYDQVWLEELSQFVEKTISVVKTAGLLAGQGGPIVMLQIENEYGNMESNYGTDGAKYVKWLSEYALSLDVAGVPWVMCQQGEGVGTAPSAEIVNACNGFYCDNWISSHAADFPNQPHMWTENWPGWFQNWGEPVPHRPAVDVAFSVARWFARGGSYMNYYMAFGGTTFGRKAGGPLIVTSYDYDVQINEYGMRAEPKFSLLLQMHDILQEAAGVLLAELPPAAVSLTNSCESHTYQTASHGDECIAFLSNWGESESCSFPRRVTDDKGDDCEERGVVVPPWSVTILTGANCSTVAYNTKTSAGGAARANQQVASAVKGFHLTTAKTVSEPIPSSHKADSKVPIVVSDWPLEQLSVTGDSTDFLWYSTAIPGTRTVATNTTLQFTSGTAGGGIFYIYIDGVRVASTLGAAGGPPVVGTPLADESSRARRSVDGWTLTSQTGKDTVVLDGVGEALSAIDRKRAVLTEGFAVSLNVTVPAGSAGRLDILSVSMGLKNYGPFLEAIQVGVVSNVTLGGATLKGFTHSVGLQGEASSFADQLPSLVVEKTSCVDLCWYSSEFATPPSVHASSHLALELSAAMGKGSVWVNGHHLGRYWNITAAPTANMKACDECPSDQYVGSYNGDKCRSGCGAPSQQYYKLPTEWLVSAKSARPNSLVLFDELGGNPSAIHLVALSMADK
eukprot:gene22402-28524_t